MIKRIINFILERRLDVLTERKTRSILRYKKTAPVAREVKTRYKKKWADLYPHASGRYPLMYKSVNGFESENYVPENIYYNRIEPILNNKAFAPAYADKNFYELFLFQQKHIFPKTFIRMINGMIYDSDYTMNSLPELLMNLTDNNTFIIKPSSETSGGRNVFKINKKGNILSVNLKDYEISEFSRFIVSSYGNNFVIQEYIVQDQWFADFNQSSLNTVRIFTYRSVRDNSINVLNSVLRFGKPGSTVDNQASGGYTVGINNSGRLNSYYIDKTGNKKDLRSIAISKEGESVPGYGRMQSLAVEIAIKYYYHRLLGFDFCLNTKNEVQLLEINCKNLEINFLQMNNGPLFGSFTDEVIEYCRSGVKNIVLDFSI